MLRPAMHRFGLLFAFALFVSVGCKAGEGDSCKEEDDCESGLMCCKASLSATARGTCRDVTSCSEPVDAGPLPDVPVVDSGEEDAAEDAGEDDAGEDAGVDDAGEDASEDAAAEDAGDDAGPEDAGPEDAATDVPEDTFDAGA